ncbi:MAG TPA: hypothetical protein VJC00_04465 [Candidatus Nanoarchaeia archaeon]|nr:hypothetical protein [Candidatus Nanoarchaeia archaeon]
MHYKSFPKTIEGSSYPVWEEFSLTEKEEFIEEQKARRDNISLMRKCIEDAKKLMDGEGMAEYQSDVLGIALSLFRKRASHVVYWKDNRCKEKFDLVNGKINSPAKAFRKKKS